MTYYRPTTCKTIFATIIGFLMMPIVMFGIFWDSCCKKYPKESEEKEYILNPINIEMEKI